MTRLALQGLRSLKDVQQLNEEDRSTYRRWARRSCALYAIVVVVLFAGFWVHDRNMTVAVQNHPAGIDATGDLPTSRIPARMSRRGYF